MANYAPPSQTTVLDTATIATLKDALSMEDIPQGFRNSLLCQLFLGSAREPGLGKRGQNLMLPSRRPMRKSQDGTRATQPVNFEVGNTAQSFTGNDILETSQADGPTETWSDFAQYTAYVSIPGTTKVKNTGRGKRLDILRSRQNQEIRQLTRVMEADLAGTNTDTTEGTQNDFAGIQHKIATTTSSSVVVQGLNQSTFTPWRNYTNTSVGSFAAGGLDAFRTAILSIAGTNGMEMPDLIATTSTVAGYFFKALEGIHRITGSLDNADLGASRLPSFMGIPIVYSDDLLAGAAYLLSFDDIVSIVHSGMDWVNITPGNPNDQWVVDQVRWVFGAAPMMLTRREKHGVLSGITA